MSYQHPYESLALLERDSLFPLLLFESPFQKNEYVHFHTLDILKEPFFITTIMTFQTARLPDDRLMKYRSSGIQRLFHNPCRERKRKNLVGLRNKIICSPASNRLRIASASATENIDRFPDFNSLRISTIATSEALDFLPVH